MLRKDLPASITQRRQAKRSTPVHAFADALYCRQERNQNVISSILHGIRRGAFNRSADARLARERRNDRSRPDPLIVRATAGREGNQIWAPAINYKQELLISSNASTQLFVGSAIKTFVLAEALIQADTPEVVTTITTTKLALDASVWSPDSQTFNPPDLTGSVSERTTMEAMIVHSDNTGTEMMLKYVGPDEVRRFIASLGLRNTVIPDSTRSFSGYLLDAPDYKNYTWAGVKAAGPLPIVKPPLNSVETLASSADDFTLTIPERCKGSISRRTDAKRISPDPDPD